MRGLLIGRFQPFHRGHLAVVQQIRSHRPEEDLLLGIGSAQASHTLENPFTAGERWEMIHAALIEANLDHVTAFPVVDIDRHAVWVAHVASLLPEFHLVYTNNPLTRLLFGREGYAVESPALVRRERYEGARIRREMISGQAWREAVPAGVAGYIDECSGVERLRTLHEHETQRSRPAKG